MNSDERIPVFGPGNRVVALVTLAEALRYRQAPNVRMVRTRGGQLLRVNLTSLSDDSGLILHKGNPRRYSHDHQTVENPPRVWMMRRLAPSDTKADLFVRAIYRASVLDNLKEAA